MHRRTALRGLAAAGLASMSAIARAQADWPARTVRLVVPFATGGTTDILGRLMATELARALGQSVVVENRAGAAGNIGVDAVAKSAPDGYTLLFAYDGTIVINPSVYPRLPFDPQRDLAPITKVADVATVLVVGPSVKAANLRELLAGAKARGETLLYAAPGTGSTGHLAGELMQVRSGTRMTAVQYKGAGPALTDVMGGQVPMLFTSVPTVSEMVRAGRVRAFAVCGSQRSAALPDTPTAAESGLADFDVSSWYGLLAPAATPRAIVERVHAETTRILARADVRERMIAMGADRVGSTPDAFRQQIGEDIARWGALIRAAGIRLE